MFTHPLMNTYIIRISWVIYCLFFAIACAPLQKQQREAGWHTSAVSAPLNLDIFSIEHPKHIRYLSLTLQDLEGRKKIQINDIRKIRPLLEQTVTPRSQRPELNKGVFLVSHFHRGNVNNLGGNFNEFYKYPSNATVAIDKADVSNRALHFVYHNKAAGYAGFWIHLFHTPDPPDKRVFLDITGVEYITFFIRGDTAGQQIELRVADRQWERKEDSLCVDEVSKFVASGRIEHFWQQAWVPVSALPERINKSELAVLAFSVKGYRKGQVYIKDLALASNRSIHLPKAVEAPPMSRTLRKALWLWTTRQILEDEQKINALVDFCTQDAISDLFMQLPYSAKNDRAGWRVEINNSNKLAILISRLTEAGIRVDALDGDPSYALERNHEKVLAVVRQVVEFNKSVLPEQRFRGVRFDIEPYLLPDYAGTHKTTILRTYLQLIQKVRVVTQRNGLTFGVDIPFWYDERNQYYEKAAELDGRPISELVIDMTDNLAIMDYRTKAYGPDGVIAHVRGELEYATKKGKRIFIGLETVDLPNDTVEEFAPGGTGPGSRVVVDFSNGKESKLYWFSEDSWRRVADTIEKTDGLFVLSQVSRTEIPAEKQTFYNLGTDRLYSVMKHSMFELLYLNSFHGFAIHSYESYRPWLVQRSANDAPRNDYLSRNR